MALDLSTLETLTKSPAAEAWNAIVKKLLDIASKPLTVANAPSEVIKRDRAVGELDHFLSSSGWDLWQAFGETVERTSDHLVRWWSEPYTAKAVLILDGLSLRELPWLLQGAKERGFTLHEVDCQRLRTSRRNQRIRSCVGLWWSEPATKQWRRIRTQTTAGLHRVR